jgi:serine protease AprX
MKPLGSKLLAVALTALLVLLATALTPGGPPTVRAGASSNGKVKISSDLKQKMSGTGKVNVVISSAGAWGSTLTNAVASNGGAVVKTYKNFNVHAATLPPAAVANLADRSDVDYIALDRTVKKLGHVSLTTGANAASALGDTTPYDGSGIGIAVMDSGIDPNHVASNAASVASRIAANVDFTGEGRTGDPYGHGTHVASIAAGNSQVAQGAYVGIGPNANLINLRVLDAQGTGTLSSLLSALDCVKTNKAAYQIRVVNMSLGTAAVDSYTVDPLCPAVRGLVNSGVVVVAAAGNEGKDSKGNKIYGQIHSPGVEPSVITVGASNTFGTDARSSVVLDPKK